MDNSHDIYRTIIEQNAQQLLELGILKGTMNAILAEAIKTNGRVTKAENRLAEMIDTKARVSELESKVESLTGWRWKITGGAAVLMIVYEFVKDRIKL